MADIAKCAIKTEGKNIGAKCSEIRSRLSAGTLEMFAAPVRSCTANVGGSSLKTIANNQENSCGKSRSFW